MRILCFGDSNTYGYDPRGYFGGRYDAEDRWVDLLAQQTGHKVINAGANGREIPRNPYALRLLAEHAPVDNFLVMLGTNDLLQGATAEIAAADGKLSDSAALSLQPHSTCVTTAHESRCMGPHRPVDRRVHPTGRGIQSSCPEAEHLIH